MISTGADEVSIETWARSIREQAMPPHDPRDKHEAVAQILLELEEADRLGKQGAGDRLAKQLAAGGLFVPAPSTPKK